MVATVKHCNKQAVLLCTLRARSKCCADLKKAQKYVIWEIGWSKLWRMCIELNSHNWLRYVSWNACWPSNLKGWWCHWRELYVEEQLTLGRSLGPGLDYFTRHNCQHPAVQVSQDACKWSCQSSMVVSSLGCSKLTLHMTRFLPELDSYVPVIIDFSPITTLGGHKQAWKTANGLHFAPNLIFPMSHPYLV